MKPRQFKMSDGLTSPGKVFQRQNIAIAAQSGNLSGCNARNHRMVAEGLPLVDMER